MYKVLEQCIGELRINHTDEEITGALSECFQILKSVSEDYTDAATVAELRADHPELAFMGDDEIEEILEQAETMRHKREDDVERLTAEDMEELFRRNEDWVDVGVVDSRAWIVATARGTAIGDLARMVSAYTKYKSIENIEQTMREYLKEKQEADKEKRREEVFERLLEETRRRNRIVEDALELIEEGEHAEVIKLLADLDDQVIKDLYQEYLELRERRR